MNKKPKNGKTSNKQKGKEMKEMKLVLLFFCTLITIAIILLLTSNIKIIANITNKQKDIYLELHLFGRIKIAKIKVTQKLLKLLKIRNDIKQIQKDVTNIKKIHPIEILKRLKPKAEKIDLELKIGIDSIMLTTYAVAIVSTLIAFLIAKLEPKESKFFVKPLYNNGNTIKINLNCIITVKVVHIIGVIIYILLKKRRKGNERTSNRRTYDYSYE